MAGQMATNVLRLEWMLHFDPSAKIDQFFLLFLQSIQYGLLLSQLHFKHLPRGKDGRFVTQFTWKRCNLPQKSKAWAYWLHNPKNMASEGPMDIKDCPPWAAPTAVSTRAWLRPLPRKRGLPYGHKFITSVWHWFLGLSLCCQRARAFRRRMMPKKLHNVCQLTDSPRRKRLAP